MAFLSDFILVRPPHETPQETTLDWIASAQARASQGAAGGRSEDLARSTRAHRRLLDRFGCGPEAIAMRGHELPGFRYAEGDVAGGGMTARMESYRRAVRRVMDELVPGAPPPEHILHVTCTGYHAPNEGQECVARRGWGASTTVTPVYHSGCYAAFPAVRLAAALVAGRPAAHARVVHTELCTLHFNPALDDPEQLVVQTLFADGHASFRVTAEAPPGTPSLEVVALREEVLPDSAQSMTWTPADWGFAMTLARDVPERICRALGGTLARLCADAGLEPALVLREAIHAIHPGGPRILDEIQRELALRDDQVAASRDVLRRFGNMSSATLPHVWAALQDERPGRLVVSCAFGPGLTASTALLRVHEGGA